MAEDLQEYQYQLDTTLEALKKDPENEELLSLKKELQELISLLAQAVPQEKEQKKKEHREGQRVKARWTDGQFYEAKIVEIDGEDVTILFEQQDDSITVKQGELKPLNFKQPTATLSGTVKVNATSGKKSKPQPGPSQPTQPKEKKEKKADAVGQRAKAWQQFADKNKIRKSNFSTSTDMKQRIGVANKPPAR